MFWRQWIEVGSVAWRTKPVAAVVHGYILGLVGRPPLASSEALRLVRGSVALWLCALQAAQLFSLMWNG